MKKALLITAGLIWARSHVAVVSGQSGGASYSIRPYRTRREGIMTIAKRLGFLGFVFVLGGTALTGPAHADTLSGGKAAIDAWITTLGGITLSYQSVPSDFPNKLKTALEKLPCTSKADVAKVEAYIHQQINQLQLTHKVKIDYGLNTECRPDSGKTAAPGKPVPLMTAATVWIRGYKDYKPSEDKPAAKPEPPLPAYTETGKKWADFCGANGGAVTCCSTLRSREAACQRAVLQSEKSNCDQAERWCQSTMKR